MIFFAAAVHLLQVFRWPFTDFDVMSYCRLSDAQFELQQVCLELSQA